MFPQVSDMKSNNYQLIFHLLISAMVIMDADSDDSECDYGIIVRRNTKYEADVGTELRIECPVVFCNISPPTVLWYKYKQHVNISDGIIEVEWKRLKESEGISYLIFRNIRIKDEGLYQCAIPASIGHDINVSVKETTGPVEQNSTAQKNDTSQKETSMPRYIVWHHVYRVFGILLFFVVVIVISVTSHRVCRGKSKNASDPSVRPSHHIYDNDL